MANTSVADISEGKKPANSVAGFSKFLDGFKPQLALALPKHLNPDRMARLVLTSFSRNETLQKCDAKSIAGSMMTASTLGLEPGVNGQGYLVPYYDKRKGIHICEFIPGWKGLVDIANRSGRCTVWTGAVFEGDSFEYQLGDSPFVHHRPQDEDDPDALTHVYAIGRVNGSNLPVIEVWTAGKVRKHRDKYNKVGGSHYSFRDWEMYARKVPLLQVLKYMPASIELSNAIAVASAQQSGDHAMIIDGDFVSYTDPETGEITPANGGGNGNGNGTAAAKVATDNGKPAAPATAKSSNKQAKAEVVEFNAAAFEGRMRGCADADTLDLLADQIRETPDEYHERLTETYRKRRAELVPA